MQHDEIIKCPKSGGDICYKIQNTADITTYMSLSCGFWTNTLMKEGEDFYNEQMGQLSELHKDLAWTDPKTDLVWIPQYVNVEDKGSVFPMGSNLKNWGWASVKVRETTEDEKSNDKVISSKYKTDMETMKIFPEREYVGALDYIGALAED